MKTILTELKNSIIATIAFAIVLCGIYPLIVYGAAQLFFPHTANGSLIEGKDRELVGSELLGQAFSAALAKLKVGEWNGPIPRISDTRAQVSSRPRRRRPCRGRLSAAHSLESERSCSGVRSRCARS
jgi:hypothetical protein